MKYKKRLERPLTRTLTWIYLLFFLGLTYFSLDIKLATVLTIGGRTFEVWRFLQWGLINTLVILFCFLAIDPILRALVYSLAGSSVSKARKYTIFKRNRTPIKIFLIVLGSMLALSVSFHSDKIPSWKLLLDIHTFMLILLGTFLVANSIVAIMEPRIRQPGRGGHNTGKAIGRLIRVGIYILGGLIAMLTMGLDPVTVATSLGLIGFALAFGLQDTVANFAAGIMINIDRPFVIGDRIRIQWGGVDTWGDVTDISLRSTWIKTPEEEMIVIPNNVIASNQIWNYTRDSPRMALHFEIGISYDSDWKLAENLILEVLKNHPLVLSKPDPYVLMKAYADSAIVMLPWFWISEARDKVHIQSDILKRIKDSFDANGVTIPFPHRTLVYHKDLSTPLRNPEPYESPLHLPSTGYKPYLSPGVGKTREIQEDSVILAPTSASYAAKYTAPIVMDTARKMNASVTAIFIRSAGTDEYDGQRALRIYNEVAKHYGIDIKLVFKEGDVLEKILETVEEESATLVMLGSTEESMIGTLTRKSVSQELLRHLNVPSMIIPFKLDADEKFKEIAQSHKEKEKGLSQEDYGSLACLEGISQQKNGKENC
jgi:small conductance mechanosensitive channel